ncbi:MAG: SDR family oxidoreductase [Hyphomicrobiaceae bacterium]|nr:SDR family oxidoreductase [Hyphomicrobiaceae bacterium]
MKLEGKHIVVTGAASGIGAALARRFAAAGAAGVVVSDLPSAKAQLDAVAAEIGGLAVTCDVAREADIKAVVAAARGRYGPIDVFFSNAGVSLRGHEESPDTDWDLSWRVHVMAHVYAARAVLPDMLARGSGYIASTASAAGLLASVGSATYGVTKHASVALAEHLAIQYGDRGIRVSVLCPQAVDTPMYRRPGVKAAGLDGVATPEAVAECVVRAMEAETFLILPHPEVAEYMKRKAAAPDRWLAGMRRLLVKALGGNVR